jgi:hypothetical protein
MGERGFISSYYGKLENVDQSAARRHCESRSPEGLGRIAQLGTDTRELHNQI